MIIVVTGTPGTGKTWLAKRLAKAMGISFIDVALLIKARHLTERYDTRRRCRIVSMRRLAPALYAIIRKEKSAIIDSHLSHYLSPRHIDRCIVTVCNLKTLERRLKARGYPPKKIRENLDAEIFDACLTEAQDRGHRVLSVDTTHGVDIREIMRKVNRA